MRGDGTKNSIPTNGGSTCWKTEPITSSIVIASVEVYSGFVQVSVSASNVTQS